MAVPTGMRTQTTTTRSAPGRQWSPPLMLAGATGALVSAHELVADRSAGSGGPPFAIALGVAVALAAVTRAIYVIVTTASSDTFRVFRAPHLFLRAAALFAIGAAVAVVMVIHEPFGDFFSHARISGETIVDVGILVAAALFLVGAGAAFSAAWEARHDERNWHRSLHLHGHRRRH